MSILSSLYSAAAGLGAHGKAIDVVSDNVANANTIGFKAGRARFADVLGVVAASALPGGGAGQGSRIGGVDQMFTQGALLGTGMATDLAVQGDGFFVVDGQYEGVAGKFFTRDGQFHVDATGNLVNSSGLRVQGYIADAQGRMGSSLQDVRVPANSTIPPSPTTAATINLNLNAGDTVPPAFDINDPNNTSNYSTSVRVYDSLGEGHDVEIYFRMSAPGAWEWHAAVDGGELTGGTTGVAQEVATGALTFTTDGALDTETTTLSDFDFLGATQDQSIAFDFGDAITTDGGTGQAGSTGYAATSSVATLNQDGYASGALAGVGISSDGKMTGTFSNGERRVIGQVALAHFRSNEGLLRAGNGLFMATEDSGLPLIGTAGSGGRGNIASGSLEQSNVDLAQEFVNLIIFQRGFQANSRTVTTADQMLQELVNIKR